ncbi:hypothetical protein PVAP13_8NG103001 [Panicum virgatum]|uniref:Uncharacterized protein n=1 Tax=Panicum virgatum TaxID=38727 RepID=A0A8T0PCR0_PANVG|nr:hypothetical protein PVAP13_8NG103001 [Panicum virgatum]
MAPDFITPELQTRRTWRWCWIPCRRALLYALTVISSMRTANHGIMRTRGCGHALAAVSSTRNTDLAPCFTVSTSSAALFNFIPDLNNVELDGQTLVLPPHVLKMLDEKHERELAAGKDDTKSSVR